MLYVFQGKSGKKSLDRGMEELMKLDRGTKIEAMSGRCFFFFKRTFLLSEAIPSGGNAVLYACAIASVYESFPHEPR